MPLGAIVSGHSVRDRFELCPILSAFCSVRCLFGYNLAVPRQEPQHGFPVIVEALADDFAACAPQRPRVCLPRSVRRFCLGVLTRWVGFLEPRPDFRGRHAMDGGGLSLMTGAEGADGGDFSSVLIRRNSRMSST
jgi:hypothetical protein